MQGLAYIDRQPLPTLRPWRMQGLAYIDRQPVPKI
jgi:hypothetical protein